MTHPVFVTGGTGYIGRPLIETLLEKGYRVHALVRPGSEHKLPSGALPVVGDALDQTTFAGAIPPEATVVHLIGTPHPNPSKAIEFRRVDLASIKATVAAARHAAVPHLVYVSVAHPAPVMQAYIAARQEGEALVRASGIRATILRPWYRSSTPVSIHMPRDSPADSAAIGTITPIIGVGSRATRSSRFVLRPMWQHIGRPVSEMSDQSGSYRSWK